MTIAMKSLSASGNTAFILQTGTGDWHCALADGTPASMHYAGIAHGKETECCIALQGCTTGTEALAVVQKYGGRGGTRYSIFRDVEAHDGGKDLRARLAEAEAILGDCATAFDGEEPSVRSEHYELIERIDNYMGYPEPTKTERDYAFDVKINAAIHVKAKSVAEARKMIENIDSSSANLGAWPNGDPILCEVSADVVGEAPFEIDGEPTA